MRLSKLYTNQAKFKNIEFNLTGLNVVYAEVTTLVRDKNNSHNLGKSLLIELIDFLLLKKISNKQEHFFYSTKSTSGIDVFEDYIFYLEILLDSEKYLTIRRSVITNSKISFSLSNVKSDGFTSPDTWEYENETFDSSKEILSSYLNFPFFRDKSYDYRKSINYAMRGQRDYQDIYRLTKFVGRDLYWKPFMFDFLGFPGKLLEEKYVLDKEIEEKKKYINQLISEFSINSNKRDEIIGLKTLKQNEINEFSEKLDKFNFYEKDKRIIATGVNEIEEEISQLNGRVYKIEYELKTINESLQSKFSFNLRKITKVFKETEITFPEQLEKNYKELIKFNKNISVERNKNLELTKKNKETELETYTKRLVHLNDKKEELLSFLQDSETFRKFKEYQKQQIILETDLNLLNTQLEVIEKLNEREEELENLEEKLEAKVKEIRKELGKTETNSKYNEFRTLFTKYYEHILGEQTILSLGINTNNNVEFHAPKVLSKTNKSETAQGKGYTYSKLFCVCFDLAILTIYNSESYYHFVYHDDVLANEDDGVKLRLLSLIKHLTDEYNIQYILSTIKSDLPLDEKGNVKFFTSEEIILRLNDKDESGTLFELTF